MECSTIKIIFPINLMKVISDLYWLSICSAYTENFNCNSLGLEGGMIENQAFLLIITHFQQDKTTFNVHYTVLISRHKYIPTNYCKLTNFCISPSRMLFSFKNSKNTETNLKGMVTTGFSHDWQTCETVVFPHLICTSRCPPRSLSVFP